MVMLFKFPVGSGIVSITNGNSVILSQDFTYIMYMVRRVDERLSISTIYAVIVSVHLAAHLFINYPIMSDFTSCACIVIYIGGFYKSFAVKVCYSTEYLR